jgi:hypothetical protein
VLYRLLQRRSDVWRVMYQRTSQKFNVTILARRIM